MSSLHGEAPETGVRIETPIWNVRLPHAPNDVVFFTICAMGLVWVLSRMIDRFSGSGELLIAAQLPILIVLGYLIRAFSVRSRSEASAVGQRRARAPRNPRKITPAL